MTGPIACNLGAQGRCELHAVDHNYSVFRGPPIEPAPILVASNTRHNVVRVHSTNGAALFHVNPGEPTRVFQPGDWT